MTDHSYGLKIARGMSMAAAAEQWHAIDRLNATWGERFRLIRGVEANIDGDGALDLSADEAAQFELVLAAPHSRLRKTEDQTSRLLAAIRTPHVHVLAHPRGRMSGSRAGVVARWDEVFAEAARHGVAIEIDGDPARQDLDLHAGRRALTAGCLFALDSDAHTTLQLVMPRPRSPTRDWPVFRPTAIVNCWPTASDRVARKVRLTPDTTWFVRRSKSCKTFALMKTTTHERLELDEHLTAHAAIAKARALLPSFRTAMLVTKGSESGELHMRPMGLQGDLSTFGGTLWFFADDRSHKIGEIEREPRVYLSFQNEQEQRYLQLAGTAALVTDRPKMHELFTSEMKAWFPDGVDDPHLVLIRIDVTNGTFWESQGGVVHVLASLTKSVVTGTPGKSSRSGTIDL